MSQHRSAMFMQSDVDGVMNDAQQVADRFECPSDFWTLMASEVADAKKQAERVEAAQEKP